MIDPPRPPYCLSRQHPELASGGLGTTRGPINSRKSEPVPPIQPRPDTPPRKHL